MRPIATPVTSAASAAVQKENPLSMSRPSTMPVTARVEPTARSMPPVIITATCPSAMMAMNAKLRVMLKKFSSFQNA